MRVLLLEPHCEGHHGIYLRWMVEGLRGRGVDVTVATLRACLEHPALRDIVHAEPRDQMTPSGRFLAFESSRGFLDDGRPQSARAAALGLREVGYWRLLRGWYRSCSHLARPDVVFVPYLDYALYAIGLLGSPFRGCPWVGLAMRPSFHYGSMGIVAPTPSLRAIKEALFFRMLRNPHLRCLLTIDETLPEYVSAKGLQPNRVRFLPQPADFPSLPSRQEARRQLRLRANSKVLLVYGGISRRHGVPELLRALREPLFPPTVDVLLAGKVHDDVREVLNEPEVRALSESGRLTVLDRFISMGEEPTMFGAADIIWAGYRGHYGPSGVATQAERAERPVLACEEGILGWQTRRHKLGKTIHPEDPSSIITAVQAVLDEPEALRGAGAVGAISASFQGATDVLMQALAPSTGSV